ncbi:MAG: helix-turn-helix domain-containing protein [Pseudomonadota bacterium]
MARFDILPQPVAHTGGQQPALMPCAACDVRELTICDALRDREIDRMAQIVTRIPVPAGRTLFQEGDDADHVYNIIDGSLRLFKLMPDGRRQITGFLFATDFVGIALKKRYAYSAETITDSVICRFPREKLEALFAELPALETRLLETAGNELIAAQDQMLLLGRKTAVERVASFLLHLTKRLRARGMKGDMIGLPMTRTDMGDYLGLTVETVSRTFTKLRRDGLIATPTPHEVEICDLDGLREVAEGS